MKRNQIEYAVIKNAIRTISVLCAANEDTLIDLLTEHLWTDDEAAGIKKSSGQFEIDVYSYNQVEGQEGEEA